MFDLLSSPFFRYVLVGESVHFSRCLARSGYRPCTVDSEADGVKRPGDEVPGSGQTSARKKRPLCVDLWDIRRKLI
jgi:hypothetical protein